MERQINIPQDGYARIEPLFLGMEHCAPGHSFGPAVRSYWLIHIVLSGRGQYRAGGQIFDLSAGLAFLIRPEEATFYRADEAQPWTYLWAAFRSDLDALRRLPYILSDPRLARIGRAVQAAGLSGETAAAAAVWEIVSCLCPTLGEERSCSERAVSIIRQQYDRPLSVQSLADELGLERSYFSRVFARETGVSPGRYLMNYRLDKAADLLKGGRWPVSVVASSVGYADPFTFSRAFKRRFGAAPDAWRRGRPSARTIY